MRGVCVGVKLSKLDVCVLSYVLKFYHRPIVMALLLLGDTANKTQGYLLKTIWETIL